MKHPRLYIAALGVVLFLLLMGIAFESRAWSPPVPWVLRASALILISGLVGAGLTLDALIIHAKEEDR